MRKFVLATLAIATLAGAAATPSFAQSRGQSRESSTGGDYYPGADRGPLTFAQVRPRLKLDKGGAYCSTNWYVLHDERGMRNEIRHCDDRRHIDIN
ncbi:UNVERIFIED_ORG: hypothetical protein LHK14_15920 [Roseateles sp. XES5]|nr:hypothetical protein [Roseateles sp. XES5]